MVIQNRSPAVRLFSRSVRAERPPLRALSGIVMIDKTLFSDMLIHIV